MIVLILNSKVLFELLFRELRVGFFYWGLKILHASDSSVYALILRRRAFTRFLFYYYDYLFLTNELK